MELAKQIQEHRTYFHKRKPMLDYKGFLERGLLVGSGMVEGGIRFVGKDRLDRTGRNGRNREPKTSFIFGRAPRQR